MKPLEQVIADRREDAAALRRNGFVREADLLESFAADVTRAAESWMRWLSEDEAVLRSDHRASWFRARFAAWEEEGLARKGHQGRREYRFVIVPRRANVDAVRELARRGEGRSSASRQSA